MVHEEILALQSRRAAGKAQLGGELPEHERLIISQAQVCAIAVRFPQSSPKHWCELLSRGSVMHSFETDVKTA